MGALQNLNTPGTSAVAVSATTAQLVATPSNLNGPHDVWINNSGASATFVKFTDTLTNANNDTANGGADHWHAIPAGATRVFSKLAPSADAAVFAKTASGTSTAYAGREKFNG